MVFINKIGMAKKYQVLRWCSHSSHILSEMFLKKIYKNSKSSLNFSLKALSSTLSCAMYTMS